MQVLQKLIFTALKSALFMGLPSRTDTCDDMNDFDADDLITIIVVIIYALFIGLPSRTDICDERDDDDRVLFTLFPSELTMW